MHKFLFAHFTGEHATGEQIYFSVSEDGRHFHDLYGGAPVMRSTIGELGVRDPFLIRSQTDDRVFLIATDLRIANGKGWEAAQTEGSLQIIVWETNDLIYWSEPHFMTVNLEGAGNVWAPEAIYDKEKEAYLVFWASKINGKNRIYAAYTKDFVTLGESFLFLEKENDVIDSTVIENQGYYYRLTKDETHSRIIMEKSSNLTGNYESIESATLSAMEGVEGPQIYQVSDNEWYLILDQFSKNLGYTILSTNNLNNPDFNLMPEGTYSFGKSMKRHGGVLPISDWEYNRLLKYYDQQNPVVDGLWADPDLVKFGENYYLYPTTDGIPEWGAHTFSVFKSKDMQSFKHQNVIVDLSTNQVPWAVSNAWAPCIVEKDKKYYYYFCGKRPDGNSCIGVAVSDTPTGPFIAKDQPLLTPEVIREEKLQISQMIDPSIYQEDDKDYLLFGNGHTGAIVELSKDMMSYVEGTIKSYEGLIGFREAIDVFKRGGVYHFTWSCGDTGSENYHVKYGFSSSLFGPVEYLYPILEKCSDRNILGTGHHSIFKEPTKNEYFIAYHRFATPLENYSKEAKGYSRETCISPVDFDEKGLMRKIIT